MIDTADAEIDQKILSVIAQAVPRRFRKPALTRDMLLQRDLGLDSIAMVSLVFRVEEVFRVNLAGFDGRIDLGRIRTVGDAVDASREMVKQAGADGGA